MRALTLAAALVGSVMLTGCIEDPCKGLQPTDQERQVVQSGGSIEREVDGTECELENLNDGFQRDS